jgi:hypothetical protein
MWWSLSLALAGPLVPVQGVLYGADGAPSSGSIPVTFALWGSASGGSALHTETQTLDVVDGRFGAALGSATSFSDTFFRDHPALWVSVTVDGAATDRVAVGAVPFAAYASYAGDAASLGGVPASSYVEATDTIPWSNISGAPAYTATGGLALTGTAFSIAGPVSVAQGGTGATSAGQGLVFAGPASGSGAPTFRALTAADVPSVDWATLNNKPTTLAGFGITDAFPAAGTLAGLVRSTASGDSWFTGGQLGVGTSSPAATLDVGGTGAMKVPVGTSAERPSSPANGMIRVNTTTGKLEYYLNGWNSVGGGLIATGGTVTDAGGFRRHTYLTSGTLNVTMGGLVDVLVVGGGGGGAGGNPSSDGNGGGGGGGVIFRSGFTVTPGTYTITVGTGGAGGAAAANSPGADGLNSVFSTLVAVGGGGGGSDGALNGRAGGSGGGASTSGSGGVGGTGTSTQGFAGGNANAPGGSGPGGGGGGGGGAGGLGGAGGQLLKGGNGGVGLAFDISGSNLFYGGGGAGSSWTHVGGTGGSGGGGNGASRVNATAATGGAANTGGGGGSGTATFASGAGGSGIVIIRYPQ